MINRTLIDLSYYTFNLPKSESILNSCYSTLGYLYKANNFFNIISVFRTTNNFKNIQINDIKIVFYETKALQKWQIPFQFNSFIKSLQPDYILAHGFGYVHYLVFLKLIVPKTKIVLQCNGYASKPIGYKKWIYKIGDKFIDGYLFTGVKNADEWIYSGIFKKTKIHSIMEGSTNFQFNPENKRMNKSYLWVGNLIDRKDPLTVLKAFEVFIEKEVDAKLTMIYKEKKLWNMIQERVQKNEKLKMAINFVEDVPHNELEAIYNQHQFFISASLNEGSGYALVEAMACGCVPIVTSIPPFEFMTNNGQSSFLFSPKKDDELLIQLIKTTNCNIELLQTKVLKQFEEKLSFEAIAKHIKQIFQSL